MKSLDTKNLHTTVASGLPSTPTVEPQIEPQKVPNQTKTEPSAQPRGVPVTTHKVDPTIEDPVNPAIAPKKL